MHDFWKGIVNGLVWNKLGGSALEGMMILNRVLLISARFFLCVDMVGLTLMWKITIDFEFLLPNTDVLEKEQM